MGRAGRSSYFSNPKEELKPVRNDAITAALLGIPVAGKETTDPQEQFEDKEIGRLEQQLNYFKQRSEQRKKRKKLSEQSGLKKTLEDVSDYSQFDRR